ncbi:P-loop containing nucleoside triphosphate hydrolase protein [Mycena filopes]|nr:P-loop containing nucleoside triphosphate hydrolase protein [Mycena filopes]
MDPATENSTRKLPVEILVLGFCRTGTASMRAALAALGYGPAHHIGRLINNPQELAAWYFEIDLKYNNRPARHDWDRLLGNYQVVADVPGILFAEELMDAYPDARVILTTRDPDQWWRSMQRTLLPMLDLKRTRLARWLDPDGLGMFVPFARRTLELLLGPLDALDEETVKRRYLEYNETIRSLAPPERFLECEVKDGWAPLCAFLGKEVPEVAFPHKNDAMAIMAGSRRQIWGIYRRAGLKVLTTTALVAAVVFAVYLRT